MRAGRSGRSDVDCFNCINLDRRKRQISWVAKRAVCYPQWRSRSKALDGEARVNFVESVVGVSRWAEGLWDMPRTGHVPQQSFTAQRWPKALSLSTKFGNDWNCARIESATSLSFSWSGLVCREREGTPEEGITRNIVDSSKLFPAAPLRQPHTPPIRCGHEAART